MSSESRAVSRGGGSSLPVSFIGFLRVRLTPRSASDCPDRDTLEVSSDAVAIPLSMFSSPAVAWLSKVSAFRLAARAAP